MVAATNVDSFHLMYINIASNHEFEDDGSRDACNPTMDDFEININHEIYDDHSLFMTMEVKSYESSNAKLPFYFDIGIMGRFISPQLDRSDFLQNVPYILEGCANLLFGAIREKIHSITSQMPFGAIYLPLLEIEFDADGEPPTLVPAQHFWEDLK